MIFRKPRASSHTTHFFFDGVLRRTGEFQPLMWSMALVAVEWLLLYMLYRKKIFLRV